MTKDDVNLTVVGMENLKARYVEVCMGQVKSREKRVAGLQGPPTRIDKNEQATA